MAAEKIKLPKDLMDKVRRYADMAGYASAEEFIIHCLEKEIAQVEESSSEDEIKKKLKGLGYIG
jgi:metal-responsive CopG/Arc/MetJ family transcriptional regulator